MNSATGEARPNPKPEIAHVLFIDVVAYSLMSMDEQRDVMERVQRSVRQVPGFEDAQYAKELICLPTGDGMALAFASDLTAPMRYARLIALELNRHESFKVRMGIHTGPVYWLSDVNSNLNVAGGGINVAQRVMDCGDGGHVLMSREAAENLSQISSAWKDAIHDLGHVEVKHGIRLHIFNVYSAEFGNPAIPRKVQRYAQQASERNAVSLDEGRTLLGTGSWTKTWTRRRWAAVTAGVTVPLLAGGDAWYLWRRPYRPKPDAVTWYRQGVDAFRSATFEKARRTLERAVEMDGHFAPAYAYLAAAYNELDATERAKDAMLQAVQFGRDHNWNDRDSMRVKGMQYIISRDFDPAQKVFAALAESAEGEDKAGALLDLAWSAEKRDDRVAIKQALTQLMELNAQNPAANMKMAQVYIRDRKPEEADASFGRAEKLFELSGDYDGLMEAYLVHAISLARRNKTANAIGLIERGLKIAETASGQYYPIRFQLALALAYRNTGEIQKSQTAAEQALKAAVANRMDSTAAIGLVDLGSAYFQRGDPQAAERYYLQGLEAAQRGRAGFTEARAKLSLGSLALEYDRPMDAMKWAEASLPFFHNAGYPREEMQNLLVWGGSENTLGKFDEAEATLRKALQSAQQIGDKEQMGVIHAYIAEGFVSAGKWPAAIAEQMEALQLYGEIRGGYRAAFAYCLLARIHARLGQFNEATGDLNNARIRIQRLEGGEAQLRARTKLGETEIAYFQTRWADALKHAGEALALDGGSGENQEAELWKGLAQIRLGNVNDGLKACQVAMAANHDKFREYSYGADRQFLAEALGAAGSAPEAKKYAREADVFFEAHKIGEGLWRSRALLTDGRANDAIVKLKQSWPAAAVQTYALRPDVKLLSERQHILL